MVVRQDQQFQSAGWAIATIIAALLIGGAAYGILTPRPDDDPSPMTIGHSVPDANAKYPAIRLAGRDVLLRAGIEVEPVTTRPLESTVTANGMAAFDQNRYVEVPPRVDGILDDITVDVGATVKAGDVLAIVQSQTVGELKASLLKAILQEEQLRWQVDKYKAASEGLSVKELKETQRLLAEQITDTARIHDQLFHFGLTEEQLAELVENKDISIQLKVRAPRAGVVVMRDAVEGEPVLEGTTLFEIADLSVMWVQLKVYESDLPFIYLGQPAKFIPDGLPDREYLGKVTWISPEVDIQTRTIQVRAEVGNTDRALRANMVGRGELPIDNVHARLVVPQSAVQTIQGQHIVFVQEAENVFEPKAVTIGLKDPKYWEVTSGVKQGDKVATAGSFLLKSNLANPEFGQPD